MTDWRPIETAPSEGAFLVSDGKEVLSAYREDGDYWDVFSYRWPAPRPADIGLTHWMPLPNPPSEKVAPKKQC